MSRADELAREISAATAKLRQRQEEAAEWVRDIERLNDELRQAQKEEREYK